MPSRSLMAYLRRDRPVANEIPNLYVAPPKTDLTIDVEDNSSSEESEYPEAISS